MLTIRRIDQTEAQLLIAGARAKAQEIGIPMCIAVVDESGQLVAFERMDGGKVTSTTIAIDKAFTAAAAKKPTHEYGASSQPGAPAYGINSAIGGRLMVVGGGIPLVVDGEVVGGIGVSSGTPQQDRECAEAALSYFMASRS